MLAYHGTCIYQAKVGRGLCGEVRKCAAEWHQRSMRIGDFAVNWLKNACSNTFSWVKKCIGVACDC